MRQKRVLLRFIEAVHFIDEDDSAAPIVARGLRGGHYLLDFLNPGEDRAEGNEIRTRAVGNHASESRFAAAGRAPKKHRANIVALNLHAQRFAGPKQIFLPDKFVGRLRTHAVRQRARPRILLLRLDRAKKTHADPRSARCRAASYKMTEAATPAFKDSTPATIGTAICASAECRISGASPAPSLPMNIAQAARNCPADESGIAFASRGAGFDAPAKILSPATRSCASNTAGAIPRSSGSRSAEPAEARSALADHGSAVPRVAANPVAPNASAERTAVPTFPGSCTPASTTTKGKSPRKISSKPDSRGRTSAAIPCGCSVAATPSKSRSVVRKIRELEFAAVARLARCFSPAGLTRHAPKIKRERSASPTRCGPSRPISFSLAKYPSCRA